MAIRLTQIGNEIWSGYPVANTKLRVTQIGFEVWLITVPVPRDEPPPPPPPGPSGVSADSLCFCPPIPYVQLNTVP